VVEKATNGKESLNITIKAPTLGGWGWGGGRQVGLSQDCRGDGKAT
jgi:hypothetical protein